MSRADPQSHPRKPRETSNRRGTLLSVTMAIRSIWSCSLMQSRLNGSPSSSSTVWMAASREDRTLYVAKFLSNLSPKSSKNPSPVAYPLHGTTKALPEQGFRSWSWRESNPRPPSGCRPCYDHSRDCGSTAAAPPGRWASRGRPLPGLSLMSAVFLAVSGLSRRQPSLLLPGCDDQAPRAITGRDLTLRYLGSGSESEVICIGRYWLCAVFGVCATPVARVDFRSRRRNRSAPCQ